MERLASAELLGTFEEESSNKLSQPTHCVVILLTSKIQTLVGVFVIHVVWLCGYFALARLRKGRSEHMSTEGRDDDRMG
jgi:hypothetical protein